METYWFLEFLGIDENADRRAVKKSYAKLLKKINQKEDPEGFAELREAYEAALEWEENDAYYETIEPSDSPSIEESPHLDFNKELESIIIEWDQGVRDISGGTDSPHDQFGAFLNQMMNDERLLNFANRSQFENYLIHTYRNPDTPLRAISFLETVRYFRWYNHSPYLDESENGRWVLEILEEQLLWENQDPLDFHWQQIALHSFLQNVKTQEEQKAWQHLVVMKRRFPLWFELWMDHDEFFAIVEEHSDLGPKIVYNSPIGYLIIFVVIVVVGTIFFCHGPPFVPR